MVLGRRAAAYVGNHKTLFGGAVARSLTALSPASATEEVASETSLQRASGLHPGCSFPPTFEREAGRRADGGPTGTEVLESRNRETSRHHRWETETVSLTWTRSGILPRRPVRRRGHPAPQLPRLMRHPESDEPSRDAPGLLPARDNVLKCSQLPIGGQIITR